MQERVNAGVALLDRERPGWWKDVDLGELSMGDCSKCVIGQVCGGYMSGLRNLGVVHGDLDVDHGFDVASWSDSDGTKRSEMYDDLAELWKAEIARRQAEATPSL